MRLDLNLATQPYQDARRFYLRWGALVACATIVTLALAWFAFSSWRHGREVGRRITQAEQQIASLEQERKQAEEVLQRPANREVRDRSAFLNSLIASKAFSWTQVFAELEKIMPPRLHVVSIAPDLSPDNRLELQLRVAGENRETAEELVRRMEGSPHFHQAYIVEEVTRPQSQAGGGVQFDIVAQYTLTVQKGTP